MTGNTEKISKSKAHKQVQSFVLTFCLNINVYEKLCGHERRPGLMQREATVVIEV